MRGGLAACTAVFVKRQFIWCVGLVAFGNIVEIAADAAFKTDGLTWTFFSHGRYFTC